jgi:putative copper resistance protein D
MIDAVIAMARFIQFCAALALFGAPAFLIYGLGGGRSLLKLDWARGLVAWCGAAIGLGAVVSLLAQTASMAGDSAMAFDVETLRAVLTTTVFGGAIIVRFGLAVLVGLLGLFLPPRATLWTFAALVGAAILASFAWTGHGAAEAGIAGQLHAANDVVHLIAAGVWIGALVALAALIRTLRRAGDAAQLEVLRRALASFSGAGSLAVALLVATGLVNSGFLVGVNHVLDLTGSLYGRLLLAKLALFGLMLLMAASNRFRLTPGLGRALAGDGSTEAAMRRLARSVWLEAAAGFVVLGLVSLLGTLAPPSAAM